MKGYVVLRQGPETGCLTVVVDGLEDARVAQKEAKELATKEPNVYFVAAKMWAGVRAKAITTFEFETAGDDDEDEDDIEEKKPEPTKEVVKKSTEPVKETVKETVVLVAPESAKTAEVVAEPAKVTASEPEPVSAPDPVSSVGEKPALDSDWADGDIF